jgi:hypothetical protein
MCPQVCATRVGDGGVSRARAALAGALCCGREWDSTRAVYYAGGAAAAACDGAAAHALYYTLYCTLYCCIPSVHMLRHVCPKYCCIRVLMLLYVSAN